MKKITILNLIMMFLIVTVSYAASSSKLPISISELTRIEWQFGRGDGSIIGKMKLLANGTISGYSHPNESRWGIEGNTLVFYHSNAKPATRFNSFKKKVVGGSSVDHFYWVAVPLMSCPK